MKENRVVTDVLLLLKGSIIFIYLTGFNVRNFATIAKLCFANFTGN